jgi:hypothetical protein
VGRVCRTRPNPVSGRIRGWLGRTLGRSRPRDAVGRTRQAATPGGIRASLGPAISEEATRGDQRYGFAGSPRQPRTVMITVAEAAKARSGG